MTALELDCPVCHKRLRVPRYVPGKQVRCPYCQETHLPAVDKPAADVLVLDETNTMPPPNDAWQMKTPEGQTYGPASKADLDEWLREGRITGDCQILRPGQNAWEWATAIYPQLAAVPTGPARYSPNPYSSPTAAPTHGLAMSTTAFYPRTPKSRLTAILLAIPPLSFFGIHRFYLGYHSIGIAQLVLTLFFPCVSIIWGLCDFLFLLIGTLDRDQEGWPLS